MRKAKYNYTYPSLFLLGYKIPRTSAKGEDPRITDPPPGPPKRTNVSLFLIIYFSSQKHCNRRWFCFSFSSFNIMRNGSKNCQKMLTLLSIGGPPVMHFYFCGDTAILWRHCHFVATLPFCGDTANLWRHCQFEKSAMCESAKNEEWDFGNRNTDEAESSDEVYDF